MRQDTYTSTQLVELMGQGAKYLVIRDYAVVSWHGNQEAAQAAAGPGMVVAPADVVLANTRMAESYSQ
jgi:hypothetical protein